MRVKAYQIVDLNNPLSLEYSERSIKSFEPVKALIDIIPYQCFTPESLPKEILFKDKKDRTLYEQACYASHYSLIKKLAGEEEFFIMEHDAYLKPDKVDIFIELFNMRKKYCTFNLGIANEFYTLIPPVARRYVGSIVNKKITGGPMATARSSTKLYQKKVLPKHTNEPIHSLWPVIGQKNQICEDMNIEKCAVGKGKIFDAPITQFFLIKKGNTIIERANKWKYTPKNNPDMVFINE